MNNRQLEIIEGIVYDSLRQSQGFTFRVKYPPWPPPPIMQILISLQFNVQDNIFKTKIYFVMLNAYTIKSKYEILHYQNAKI